jgi:hypothetical protein
MKKALVLAALSVAMSGFVSAAVMAAEPAVVAQDLKKMRIPGRVAAVMWTRRPEYYTLQLAYPGTSRIMRVAKEDPSVAAQGKNVQMWLLRADGTVILPLWRSIDPAAPAPSSTQKPITAAPLRDVIFRFPLSAGKEAVAAALQIGDSFVVDRIEPFED